MVGSGLLLLGGCILITGLALDRTYSKTALPWVYGLFFWIGVIVLVPSFTGGIGLLRRGNWGRILIVIVSVELLFMVPVGTLLGVFGLWTLLGSGRTWTPEARIPTPGMVRQRYALLLTMAYVAAGFLIVIGGGFLIFGGGGNEVSPRSMLLAGVLIGSTAIALHFRGRIGHSSPAQLSRNLVMPAPAGTPPPVVCAHLEPFESTMRAAGITIESTFGSHLRARCRIYVPALDRRFGPLLPVTYSEFFQPERSAEDNPTARLSCRQCGSFLDTLHPIECTLRTPWFPSSPPPLTLIASPARVLNAPVTAIAVSPSGLVAAVASGSHGHTPECELWDIAKHEIIRRFPLPGVTRTLAWTPDESALIAGRGAPWPGGPGSRGASLFVFDAASGAELRRFGHNVFGVRGVAVSPDGSLALVSAMLGETRAEGSSLEIWELASGRVAGQIARLESSTHQRLPYFTGVSFTPDGRFMIAGCDHYVLPARAGWRPDTEPPWWWNRSVRVWSARDHQEIDLIRHYAPVVGLTVSTDSTHLLAAGNRLGAWRLSDGAGVWDQASFIDYPAAASADGRLIARGVGHREDNHGPCVDTAVELYDGRTGEFLSLGELRTIPTALAFAPGGGILICGGEEGELKFWDSVQRSRTP